MVGPSKVIFATSPDKIGWHPRDVWWCILAVLLSQLLVLAVIWGIWLPYRKIAYWISTPLGAPLLEGFRAFLTLLATVFCAKTRSIGDFFHDFDLRLPNRANVLVSAILGVISASLATYLGSIGQGSPRPMIEALRGATANHRSYFTLLVIWVALIEEIILRGFCYKAFRGSWGVAQSTTCVLFIDSLIHWDVISSGKMLAIFLFVVIGICLCVVRERTNSLWNCILFHFVYDAILSSPISAVLLKVFGT